MEYDVILAGNPNVGKSTVFNSLTGMKQHTGNWSGKTVELAFGHCRYKAHENVRFKVTDLPGTYSLTARSREEEIARDYIAQNCENNVVVVICDANCLERNLNLALQIIETAPRVILCVNFMDEAFRNGIRIDARKLSEMLGGTPVVLTTARRKKSLSGLPDAVFELMQTEDAKPRKLVPLPDEHDDDKLVSAFINTAEKIHAACVSYESGSTLRHRKIDRLLTNKLTGIPAMIIFFIVIFWITIAGANYPSELLMSLFTRLGGILSGFLIYINAPQLLVSLLIDGVYSVLTWVVAVMLPPMAIFFPLFTLLEDLGYLPRIAFNLDGFFKKANACGKQALTMAMGFGCNACGVIGARIIDSPRERLIAILTNVFVPCNGRFPLLLIIIALFFTGATGGFTGTLLSALFLTLIIILGVAATFLTSRLLSNTILKGIPSSFTLELPPYRRPQIMKVLVRSLLDRTLFVLGRAVIVAAPAGLLIWVFANVQIGAESVTLLQVFADALDPFAKLLGMDGVILLAFILAFPASEIVLPIIIMCYLATGTLVDMTELSQLRELLVQNGWTWVTAVSVALFSLMHFPCSTTCLTIFKETGSAKWTAAAFLIPTGVGVVVCMGFNLVALIFA